MRAQKLQDASQESETAPIDDGNKKKRKASEDDGPDTIRKRAKASNPSLPAGFFDPGQEEEEEEVVTKVTPTSEIQMKIPSRPATPLKPAHDIPSRPEPNVDEDEWAAFQADIAAAERVAIPVSAPIVRTGEGVISAPAMTAAELKAKDEEENNKRRRERLEAEAEGDKEDAARKLEEEFEEMESLEQRVRSLREKREALRRGRTVGVVPVPEVPPTRDDDMEDDEDDEDDDDDWDGFRIKG